MDDVITIEEIDRKIEQTMRERGVDRAEAELIVGRQYDEWHNDLLFLPPLTAEQRRHFRRTLREVMVDLGELPAESADSPVEIPADLSGVNRRSAD